jgi:hypothetical protein
VVEMIREFHGPDGLSAMFDDDGAVAYLYLLRERRIVTDVWLYNRHPTPTDVPWKVGAEPPFLNPSMYLSAQAEAFSLPVTIDDMEVTWSVDCQEAVASISLRGEILASVREGEKPGRSRLVSSDGPLAKRLTDG